MNIRARFVLKLVAAAMALAAATVTHASQATESNEAKAGDLAMNVAVREQVRALRAVAVSPDGRQVLATITETTAKGGQPHLWLLAPSAEPRQLTFGAMGEEGAAWSADGKSILFLSEGGGARAVFRLALAGGAPMALRLSRTADGGVAGNWGSGASDSAISVLGFSLSIDGKTLAVWATDQHGSRAGKREGEGDDAYIHHVDHAGSLFLLVDVATGAPRTLKLAGGISSVSWSADSADLLVTTYAGFNETGLDAKVWRVTRAHGAAEAIDLPNRVRKAAYLPKRKRIAFSAQCLEDAPPFVCIDLFVKDLTSGETRNLTRGLDGEIPSEFIVDRNGDLVMTIATHMQERAARISTSDGAVQWLEMGQPDVTGLATNAGQTGWAMIASGSPQPPVILHNAVLGSSTARLATPAVVPAAWPSVPSKLITWTNEGLEIEGLLYLPRVRPGALVPLVVHVHGGPARRFADDYSNLVQMLVAEGWAVLQPNPRGSTGYGKAFLAANKNDLGGADYRDIMTGIDVVAGQYPIDRDRLALIGFSYGGAMAGFAVGKTTRFKAIVSGAPVINQFSQYGTGGESASYYDRWYLGRPWLNFEDAWRQSPLAYAKTTKTPFLLLHGAADVSDPIGQSLEMWRALRHSGTPVELVVYPREGHVDLRENFLANVSTEPWHGVDMRRRMFGFIRAAFAGNPDPLAAAR